MSDYPIKLTRIAAAVAATRYSVEAVIAKAREEVDECMENGLEKPEDLMFHCFDMPGAERAYEWIVTHDGEGGIEVDTASAEESDPIPDGPFKGRRLMIPRPDSKE